MPKTYQIKQTVQFPEQTAIQKELSENVLFDIVQEECFFILGVSLCIFANAQKMQAGRAIRSNLFARSSQKGFPLQSLTQSEIQKPNA